MNNTNEIKSRKRRRCCGTATASKLVATVAMVVATSTMETSAFSFVLPSQTIESPAFTWSMNTREHSLRRKKQRPKMVATPIELETTDATESSAGKDLTMEDVVASATLEIEERQHHARQRQQFVPIDHKSPFDWFEAYDKARILESERVGLDRLRNDETASPQDQWGGTLGPSEIVSWQDLQTLLEEGLAGSTDDDVSRRTQALYRSFTDSGGFVIVRLDEEDAATVADLWSTMEAYFSLPTDQLKVDRQVLEKADGTHDPDAGYHFHETFMNKDGVIMPETIPNALQQHPSHRYFGEAHTNGIEGSYKLFAGLAKTVGTIIAGGALQKDLSLVDTVVTSMLDDRSGHPFVNADHRLSRYVVGNRTTTTSNKKESLISHTDWTLTTCVPLSAVPGLQVWRPRTQEWVVPEALLGGSHPDRTKYVVVMAGKWIELLTNRRIASCVHRVVTTPQQQPTPRLSAPFFCRPKRPLFDLFRDEFQDSWWERPPEDHRSLGETGSDEAIAAMGGYFADWIRFLEGDRDPDIPGGMLDLCLDRGDRAPGCFSIDNVLG